MPHDPGEGPPEPRKAKERIKAWIEDDKHKADKGSWKDMETIDDPVEEMD